jgi:ribulose 1,5-bisphosphate carboxylase large subunit-like protein
LEAKKQKHTSNITTNISKLLYVATLVSKVGNNSLLINRSATKHMAFNPK